MAGSPSPSEVSVVLALARGACPTALEHPPRWDRVCALAERHGVAALCGWTLSYQLDEVELERLAVPEHARKTLREAYLFHLLRNESLRGDLTVVSQAMEAHRVDALVLKGPWLAFHAYPDPGARPVGDIDLCVREDDYIRARLALLDAGYAAAPGLPESAEGALRRAHYGQQLRFTARGRRPVELHFRLVNIGPPDRSERWVWESARTLALDDLVLRVPGPDAMLLHLVLHASQHAFSVLRLLHDIRWASEADAAKLDPPAVVRRIRELHCGAAAYHALLLASELAGAPPPEPELAALRPSAARRALFSKLWRLPAVRRLDVLQPPSQLEAPALYLLEMGRLRDKARYLAGMISEAGGMAPLARRTWQLRPRATTSRAAR